MDWTSAGLGDLLVGGSACGSLGALRGSCWMVSLGSDPILVWCPPGGQFWDRSFLSKT